MKTIEEAKKWLIENRTDENGDLDLSGLDFSDFDGDIDISGMKVKCNLYQDSQTVGGGLRQDCQKAEGRIIHDLGSLNEEFKKMSPAEKGEFISQVFVGDDGKIRIDDVDLSLYHTDVGINRWTVDGNLSQCCHKVANSLFQNGHEVEGSLFQSSQKVWEDLLQNGQTVGGTLYQDEQEEAGCIAQDRQEAEDERKDEPMCVAPDYEGECERLRKELAKASRRNEILLWALDKALGEDD